MNDESFRIDGLDFLRGCAVMGILLANVISFGLPSAVVSNPFAYGMESTADIGAWLFNFLLVDGKMRALFALLFGASILLVMEAAEMRGEDGRKAHRRRMLWLLVFGLAHFVLLWSGDILAPLAISGLIAALFVRLETLSLVKLSLALLLLAWLISLGMVIPGFWLRAAAEGGSAPADVLTHWRAYADALGIGESNAITAEIAHYLQGYGDLLLGRSEELPDALGDLFFHGIPEMLAFMALGMAMLKGGFLAGQWQASDYRATWSRALLVGLLPMLGLAAWVLLSGDPLVAQAVGFGWSMPLRLPLAVALAAMAMEICVRMPDAAPVRAIREIGRLALSNYLLTSLVMSTLFYGYGFGMFGLLSRSSLLPAVGAMWLAMLVWSVAWRHWLRLGPAEWLWRRLARARRR